MADTQGRWRRPQSSFRDWIRADGSTPFAPQPGRYHLYLAHACPWSHRIDVVLRLKGLQDACTVSWAAPFRDERGWAFPGGPHRDELNGFTHLMQAYEASDPGYDGRPTLPVLWDTATGQIVNNESGDVMRMLGSELDAFAARPELDLYPAELRPEIDRINAWGHKHIQDGVYGCGFATSQAAYDAAFTALFDALAELEHLLESRRYLAGDVMTEADWRLFPTLVRFDPVYHTHFRCNGRRLVDHPSLWAYARELFQMPGVAATVNLDEIRRHYYTTHDQLNPKRIIPAGPLDVDWHAPHGRDRRPDPARTGQPS